MESVNFVKIAWFGKHFGEEPPLIGEGVYPKRLSRTKLRDGRGAGTIFFTGCNLHCVYCQNYQISQQGIGKNYSIEELAEIMLKLQNDGAANIDLVAPTIWAEQIKQAIVKAREKGLKISIIWNSNGYDGAELIKKMEELIDIYLPDFKYSDNGLAFKYSGIKNYVEKTEETIREMINRVGVENVIVRHLILPNNIENSFKVLEKLKQINKNICISLMTQYEPVFRAKEFPEINRRITEKEFEKVHNYQLELGLAKGWVQEMGNQKIFLPDFTKDNPFQ
jgi:putative pyruvate formate lyase activating enzyme